ncbi:GAF domain-containing protein [Beggiatoa leptomitoformis]|uniref:GAF domain-containing protein n=2 Tax=Beggiatoa leptomitoformis TaxID=288004 RepID=A0A2N9YJL9_9GAMM|nr:GAF domain-containing protein [Beggiatoa leptomitoformis]AUI70711.1 GAF domain-containing protein [Beggiatoa leptomitoformis]
MQPLSTTPVENILDPLARLKALNAIGIALSAEKNGTRLLERILKEAKRITFADGGTLYTRNENNGLDFEILLNNSLKVQKGGTSGDPITFPPLPMYNEHGEPNLHTVAVCAALRGQTINIADAYSNPDFDFSGTRAFDQKTGYRSKSFLTVPMKNNEDEVIGVLQLINAINPISKDIQEFSQFDQELVESLASQAAVAMVNQQLIEEQRKLFESFIQLIASAIDNKSPYTGGHCRRVPELTMMLADAVANTETGTLKHFQMTEEDRYELYVAGWLHDCGKVTTPEYVVDKATKLQTIFDRIHLIDARFEVLKRDAEIKLLRDHIANQTTDISQLDKKLDEQKQQLNQEKTFIQQCNIGGEFMDDAHKNRVRQIAEHHWINPDGQTQPLLTEEEIYNLMISRGTLTTEERQVINNHIVATISMLEQLPYPKHLRRVPEFAGGHHERMDGKGYPKGLTREQMSIQARIMGIADIFEALTAGDRPYKKAMPLSKALTILGNMKLDNHIDPDLFDIFMHNKIYMQYAEKFLPPEQIDTIDLNKIPGYVPQPEHSLTK